MPAPKFGAHQPLNRQRDRYAREGVELSLSTLADQVGTCTAALMPLYLLIEAHVLAAERLHGDDTTVPVLAKTKTDTGRIWTYVRDDRPFGGPAPPAAIFHYSRDRRGEHPVSHLRSWRGILQADAYAGYNALFHADRLPSPLTRALCWSHARRYFFELADVAAQLKKRRKKAAISPLAVEAVRRIDVIFDIERAINSRPAQERLALRQELSAPLVADLEEWMRDNRSKLSKNSDVAEAMDYMLKAWPAFTAFLGDGRICLTNNAAERALRGIALGRKSWLFAGSDRGGQRTAFMLSLIGTAKLNDIDPQAWLAGSPMFSRRSQTSHRAVSTNCFPGTGAPQTINAKRPDPRFSPDAYGQAAVADKDNSARWQPATQQECAYFGKDKRIAFGRYPEVGLAEARQKQDEARQKLEAR